VERFAESGKAGENGWEGGKRKRKTCSQEEMGVASRHKGENFRRRGGAVVRVREKNFFFELGDQ